MAGTTGVEAAVIGAALTLANTDVVGGTNTGGNYVESVTLTKKPGAFSEISVTAVKYPGIS